MLRIDTSTSSFLDRSGPEWRAYQESVELFGGDEFLVVAHEGQQPFDQIVLREMAAFSDRAVEASGVRRVDSLATVPLVRGGRGEEVRLDPALSASLLKELEASSEFIAAVRSDLVAPRALVSADELVFASNVILDRDVDSDRTKTVSEIRALLPDAALVSGVPVFRTAVNARTEAEVLLFAPLTLAVISMILVCFFRNLVSVFLPIVVGAVGSVAALGVMGAVGVRLSLSTLILPSVLLALGCAYTMHALVSGEEDDALSDLARLKRVARPVVLSGVTTAIGFLAMSTVNISAIRELATFGAVGVAAITAAVVTLVPSVLALSPARRRVPVFPTQVILQAVIPRVAGARTALTIWIWIGVLGVAGLGLLRLEVSTDIIQWFPRGSTIRSDYEQIRARLSGISPVNVVVEARPGESVLRPDVLAAIGELTETLDDLPQVGRATSIVQPLLQLHQVVTGSVGALPSSAASAEQYLLVLDGADYIRDLVALDRSAANIVLRVDNNSSSEIVALGEWIELWWAAHGPADVSATTTGIMHEFGRAEEEIAYGQIRGLALAFASIAVVLLVLLRDFRLALVALLPNAVPLGIAFGCMGFLAVPLDAATVCLGSLALGIAVDDTIHIVAGYHDELRAGSEPWSAIQTSLHRVLPALLLSTATIAAGFAVLGLSDFTLIRNLGLVTSALVVLCLVADLTLLPALLVSRLSSAERG